MTNKRLVFHICYASSFLAMCAVIGMVLADWLDKLFYTS